LIVSILFNDVFFDIEETRRVFLAREIPAMSTCPTVESRLGEDLLRFHDDLG
jgi:hypothetical protein